MVKSKCLSQWGKVLRKSLPDSNMCEILDILSSPGKPFSLKGKGLSLSLFIVIKNICLSRQSSSHVSLSMVTFKSHFQIWWSLSSRTFLDTVDTSFFCKWWYLQVRILFICFHLPFSLKIFLKFFWPFHA